MPRTKHHSQHDPHNDKDGKDNSARHDPDLPRPPPLRLRARLLPQPHRRIHGDRDIPTARAAPLLGVLLVAPPPGPLLFAGPVDRRPRVREAHARRRGVGEWVADGRRLREGRRDGLFVGDVGGVRRFRHIR